jgi:hypothetical protein
VFVNFQLADVGGLSIVSLLWQNSLGNQVNSCPNGMSLTRTSGVDTNATYYSSCTLPASGILSGAYYIVMTAQDNAGNTFTHLLYTFIVYGGIDLPIPPSSGGSSGPPSWAEAQAAAAQAFPQRPFLSFSLQPSCSKASCPHLVDDVRNKCNVSVAVARETMNAATRAVCAHVLKHASNVPGLADAIEFLFSQRRSEYERTALSDAPQRDHMHAFVFRIISNVRISGLNYAPWFHHLVTKRSICSWPLLPRSHPIPEIAARPPPTYLRFVRLHARTSRSFQLRPSMSLKPQ